MYIIPTISCVCAVFLIKFRAVVVLRAHSALPCSHDCVQVRKEVIRQAKQVLDVQSPAQRAAVEHVDRIMHDVSTFPEVVDGKPRASVVTISYNALAAAREDALRGEWCLPSNIGCHLLRR